MVSAPSYISYYMRCQDPGLTTEGTHSGQKYPAQKPHFTRQARVADGRTP